MIDQVLLAVTATKLADIFIKALVQELTPLSIEEKAGLFQAQLCQTLAAFILSHTIKLMQSQKLSDEIIKKICEDCIYQAMDFAKELGYSQTETH